MRELIRTNDAILLHYAQAVLKDAGIEALVFDQHMSLAEGSIGAFPRRLVVGEAWWPAAIRVLRDAGLSEWLRDEEQ